MKLNSLKMRWSKIFLTLLKRSTWENKSCKTQWKRKKWDSKLEKDNRSATIFSKAFKKKKIWKKIFLKSLMSKYLSPSLFLRHKSRLKNPFQKRNKLNCLLFMKLYPFSENYHKFKNCLSRLVPLKLYFGKRALIFRKLRISITGHKILKIIQTSSNPFRTVFLCS